MDNNGITVLICHGSACVSAGAPKIKKIIENEIKNLGLSNIEVKNSECQHDIKLKITGCHGFCQRGPTVIIEPEGIFYTEVNLKMRMILFIHI